MKNVRPFGVKLTPKIAEKFNRFIESQKVSRNLLVNQAIDEYLDRRFNQKPSEAA